MKRLLFSITILFFLDFIVCENESYATFANEGIRNTKLYLEQIVPEKDKSFVSDAVINIKDQKVFDNLQSIIKQSIRNNKKRIEIRFQSGNYFFNQNHIDFEGYKYPDVSIRFIGDNCFFFPKGRLIQKSFNKKDGLDYNFSYITPDGEDLNLWTPFYTTDSLIQIVDNDERICRLHIPDTILSGLQFSKESFIQFTEWYYTRICKIDSVGNQFIYFTVPQLKIVKDQYNVNYDYIWHKRMPRFRIFDTKGIANSSILKNRNLIEGQSGVFCKIFNSKFKRVSFEGINIYGNKTNNMVFDVKRSTFEDCFLIYNCHFLGQRGGVVSMINSSNLTILNCVFSHQYSTIIDSDNLSSNTRITNNTFIDCGLGMTNSKCIISRGQDYYIADNTFKNFGYSAIRCGLWYKEKQKAISTGIVENNILYCTEDYLSNIDERGLIDSGAICIATKNDHLEVRYNYIHDISGAGSNRGIYCDGGAKNFKIFGNIILNILNSRCIDARYDKAPENYDKSIVANINKEMKNNIINGSIRFQGKPVPANGCFKGENIIFFSEDKKNEINNVIDHVEVTGKDLFMTYKRTKELKIIVPYSTRQQLRKLPFYNNIKNYIDVR